MRGHLHLVELEAESLQPALIRHLMWHLQKTREPAAQFRVRLVGHELEERGLVVSRDGAVRTLRKPELRCQPEAIGRAHAKPGEVALHLSKVPIGPA